MAKTQIWDGSAWRDLQGPQGDPGPTVVSTDAGNASRLGTDGKLFTPTVTPPTASTVVGAADSASGLVGTSSAYARADHSHPYPTAAQVGAITQAQADARYVELAGDSMTGALNINGSPAITQVTGDARYVNVTGDTMTGNLNVSSTGDRLVAVTSTSAGSASFNLTSGANAGQVSQSGTTLFQTNFASGGVIAVTQVGAGQIRFTANSVQALTVSGTGIGVTGNITSTGTAHSFAANSIAASAVTARPAILPTDPTYTPKLSDANSVIINSTSQASVSIVIPDNAAVAFPIGTRLEILDASATSTTIIQASAAVTLQWNSNLSAVGGGQSGGAGSIVALPGPFSRCLLYKIGTNSWVVIS